MGLRTAFLKVTVLLRFLVAQPWRNFALVSIHEDGVLLHPFIFLLLVG